MTIVFSIPSHRRFNDTQLVKSLFIRTTDRSFRIKDKNTNNNGENALGQLNDNTRLKIRKILV
ncbi:hypothetical protein G9A89_018292 [Geosiphon pyriformis]|nr:hypothetical protein G9A89_018292 [Geosiphon pyriformis]